MVWVILGPLAPFLREQFGLSATAQGLLVAVPLLGGSLFRPVLGVLADRIGGRRAGLIGLALTVAAAGRSAGRWPPHRGICSCSAFFLGIAGASFAVALPLASRWYPPEYQGLAMGIVGAGNSGSLMATLFAPRLAERIGWANTFGLALLPGRLRRDPVRARSRRTARRRPAATSWSDYVAVLREPDTLWFSFLYSLTFGGFVGFTSFLTTFFHEQYHVSRVSAGDFTTMVVVSGSLMRPLGGWLSDRLGGYRLLLLLLARRGDQPQRRGRAAAAVCRRSAAVRRRSGCSAWATARCSSSCRSASPARMGIVTGIVGAAGGLGGFFLPSVLGAAKDATGTYAIGLLAVRRGVPGRFARPARARDALDGALAVTSGPALRNLQLSRTRSIALRA